MTEEKKERTGEVSRREFLKDVGLLVGSTAIGSTVLLAACGGETVTETATKTVTTTVPGGTLTSTAIQEVARFICPSCGEQFDTLSLLKEHIKAEHPTTFPLSEGYLVYDSKKCAGCFTCMMACSAVHEGKASASLSRLQISRDSFGRFPEDLQMNLCRQCVDPLCVKVCLMGACHVDNANGNVRVIDELKCTGCQLCIQACPYIPHRPIWNAEKKVALKCDLCINTPYWSEEGGVNGKQACVEVCPTRCLKLVKQVPSQSDDEGYDVNLRTAEWGYLIANKWPDKQPTRA